MPNFKPIVEQIEDQVGGSRVFGVLYQLEDEVRALAVEVPEQVENGRVPAVARDVLGPDLLVVGAHLIILAYARRSAEPGCPRDGLPRRVAHAVLEGDVVEATLQVIVDPDDRRRRGSRRAAPDGWRRRWAR